MKPRIPSLDVIRGFAILGILLANIPAFSGPISAEISASVPLAKGSDAVVEGFTLAFVSGKFRCLLAILFGYGIQLQFAKAKIWPGKYRSRAAMLGLLGALHAVLIWFGDILFPYAVTSFIVSFLVVRLSHRLKRWIIWPTVVAVLFGLLSLVPSPPDSSMNGLMATEIKAFTEGGYLAQLGFRASIWPIEVLIAVVLTIHFVPLFLVGALLARKNFLSAPSAHPELASKFLKIGFGLGLPLNLLGLLTIPFGNAGRVAGLWELAFAPILTLGVITKIALWAEQGRFSKLFGTLAEVGRLALSNYILQSVLASALLIGLGLWNRTSALQDLGIVLVVWVGNLIFTKLWTRTGRPGPLEFLLRVRTTAKNPT